MSYQVVEDIYIHLMKSLRQLQYYLIFGLLVFKVFSITSQLVDLYN